MKNPLWILNSSLILLISALVGIMLFMRIKIPQRKSLIPQEILIIQKNASKINIARIYESDLFQTYNRPEPKKPNKIKTIVPPVPPKAQTRVTYNQQTPEFLAPLEIDIKGILFNSNPHYSRAIIEDKKTKKELLYKIGDFIADANLIYIGKNKTIFIRSNGQQETLFISEDDAKESAVYSNNQEWRTIIEQLDRTTFMINADLFVKKISNLAQFFDMLDITTAFIKGKSIGCRIGKIDTTLGESLGLKYGDIVTMINERPTTSTGDRVAIYKEIKDHGTNQKIVVSTERNGKKDRLVYIIYASKSNNKNNNINGIASLPAGSTITKNIDMKPAENNLAFIKENIGQSRIHNEIAQMLNKNDKKAMINYGGQNAVLKR